MTDPLDRSDPLPLWAQLERHLRQRLADGEFTQSFPGELELAETYGVSRTTVREALRRLRADGTVVAERGRKPRLAGEIRQLGVPYSLYDLVQESGLEQRNLVRVQERRRNARAAIELEVAPETDLLHVERLRLAGDEPLALDEIWAPFELAGALVDVDLRDRGFYEELALRTGIRLTGGREHLRAVLPSPTDRALLSLPRGTAAFEIERLGRFGERVVEWRRTLIRADRFSVVAEFTMPAGHQPGEELLVGAVPHPLT